MNLLKLKPPLTIKLLGNRHKTMNTRHILSLTSRVPPLMPYALRHLTSSGLRRSALRKSRDGDVIHVLRDSVLCVMLPSHDFLRAISSTRGDQQRKNRRDCLYILFTIFLKKYRQLSNTYRIIEFVFIYCKNWFYFILHMLNLYTATGFV